MEDSPVVELLSGAVRGVRREDGTEAYLGIPYAEAPFGELRFQRPQKRSPWSGVRDARDYGPTPQRRTLAEITTIPEPSIPGDDILSVNVFTTAKAREESRLPVLVWIHGGGYVAGSPASFWYDGRSFARDGVITVVISYRLGFEGFGWLPDAPVNRGVLDWIAALEWVRDNIVAFGGDPARVTVAGQSAGGGAAMSLLALPQAQPLFRSVISASGVPADVPLERAQALTAGIAEKLGVDSTAAGFGSVPEDDLIAAQGWSADAPQTDDPLEILQRMSAMDGTLPFGPIVDGDSYPASVEDALLAGRGADKPLLVGSTLEEFGSFFNSNIDMFSGVDPAEALTLMGASPAVSQGYAALLSDLPTAMLAGRYVTDVMFRKRIINWLRMRRSAPTWVYDFSWRSEVSGASEHCLDVPFAFDVLDAPGVERVAGKGVPQSLADKLHRAFVSFIEDADPGWQKAAGDDPTVAVFNEDADHQRHGYDSANLLATTADA